MSAKLKEPRVSCTFRVLPATKQQIIEWDYVAFHSDWGSTGRVFDRLVAFAKANDFNPSLPVQPRIVTAKKR